MVKKGQRMEENSLVVQWLGFGCGTAGTWVQSLVWELRSHKSQSSPGSPSNKKKNDRKVMMENNFREQWVGGTLRKPDERDSAREETKVSRFPQHYLAVDVKVLIYFCLITKGFWSTPHENHNGCSLLYPGTCIQFASVDREGVPAFLIRVAFSSKGHKFWGKQSFSKILGNVT